VRILSLWNESTSSQVRSGKCKMVDSFHTSPIIHRRSKHIQRDVYDNVVNEKYCEAYGYGKKKFPIYRRQLITVSEDPHSKCVDCLLRSKSKTTEKFSKTSRLAKEIQSVSRKFYFLTRSQIENRARKHIGLPQSTTVTETRVKKSWVG
jgi:hypothetical protein